MTLFRVYPKDVNAVEQYQKELNDLEAKDKLIYHNKLQQQVADKLWEWFRDGNLHDGYYAPYISYTSGFRPTEYNEDHSDFDAVIYALKSYPMNVNINAEAMQVLLQLVLAARDEVLKTFIPLPYSKETPAIDSDEPQEQRTFIRVENLLSGIARRHLKRS